MAGPSSVVYRWLLVICDWQNCEVGVWWSRCDAFEPKKFGRFQSLLKCEDEVMSRHSGHSMYVGKLKKASVKGSVIVYCCYQHCTHAHTHTCTFTHTERGSGSTHMCASMRIPPPPPPPPLQRRIKEAGCCVDHSTSAQSERRWRSWRRAHGQHYVDVFKSLWHVVA